MLNGWDERIRKIAFVVFMIFSVAVCLSEPFSRHCVKVILFFTMVRCVINPHILFRLKKFKKVLLSMLIFFGVMFLSCVYGGNFIEEIGKYRFLMHYNALLVPSVVLMIDSYEDIKKLTYGLFISLMITNIYVIYQHFLGVYRPDSFIKATKMVATMFYVIIVPLMLINVINKVNLKKEKIFSAICLFLSLISFVFMNTRGAWLALFPIIILEIVYCLPNWKNRLIGVACIMLLVFGMMASNNQFSQRLHTISNPGGSEQSINERYLMWQSAWKMGLDYPIMGVGMGNYSYEYNEHYISPLAKEPGQLHAHNNFMQFFAENGIFGVAAYCLLLGGVFYWTWTRRNSYFAKGLFFYTLAMLLYSLSDYTFAGYNAMRLYWFAMGLCLAGASFETGEA